ncbi:MAG: hypothetical protein HY753_06905, partial [Nitrospirae bacterium]|nr:hypothetical protein [Nitrospirota bacterium]
KSNKSTIISRDKDPLSVDCYTDAFAGQSIINGKVNAGYWAVDFFVIDFCLISCWIDGLSGSWAEYPSMIDVPLDFKDDAHFKRLEELSSKLKQSIEEYNNELKTHNERLKYDDSIYHQRNLEKTQQKIENAQKTTDLINIELSLRESK